MAMMSELVSVRLSLSVTVTVHVTEVGSPVPSRLYRDATLMLQSVAIVKYLQHDRATFICYLLCRQTTIVQNAHIKH